MTAGTIRSCAPIKKLPNLIADYLLRIKCRKCGHEGVTEPHFLANLLGYETPLTTVALRLRRSKRQVRRECELSAMTQPKPRGNS